MTRRLRGVVDRMARKKSVRLAASLFIAEMERIGKFVDSASFSTSADEFTSWIYECAVIKANVSFERLILSALVGAINNDTSVLGSVLGIELPRHLTDEVCRYLIVGNRYFDFRGRDGLISRLREYLPEDHYLVRACKSREHKRSLELLFTLRNLSAHESSVAKKAALKATERQRIASAGSWLKTQGRLEAILDDLVKLAREIESRAPY